jgi:hypothetical protein
MAAWIAWDTSMGGVDAPLGCADRLVGLIMPASLWSALR